jgi:hypothetical protein
MQLEARWHFEHGREEEALSNALRVLRLGQMVETGEGSLIDYLVGVIIKAVGFSQIERLGAATSLSSSQLVHYVDRLAEYQSSDEAYVISIKNEYTVLTNSIRDIKDGAGMISPQDNLEERLFRTSLRPNMTKNMFLKSFETAICAATQDYSRLAATNLYDPYAERSTFRKLCPEVLAASFKNAGGEMMYRMGMPACVRLLDLKCRNDVCVGALRLLLATKAYQLDHGDLPEALADLIPDYMDAVPVDAYDGKPMCYSKEKKIVFSVGTDGIDSGGATNMHGGSRWEADDYVFSVDF